MVSSTLNVTFGGVLSIASSGTTEPSRSRMCFKATARRAHTARPVSASWVAWNAHGAEAMLSGSRAAGLTSDGYARDTDGMRLGAGERDEIRGTEERQGHTKE
eukprot:5018344-Prymnesium_polylepis.4